MNEQEISRRRFVIDYLTPPIVASGIVGTGLGSGKLVYEQTKFIVEAHELSPGSPQTITKGKVDTIKKEYKEERRKALQYMGIGIVCLFAGLGVKKEGEIVLKENEQKKD